MRSTSAQISVVKRSPPLSVLRASSCAAPLMPASGFLISCASIDAAAPAARAFTFLHLRPLVFAAQWDETVVTGQTKSIEEVIRRANDNEYGLAAGVWTKDIDTANTLSRGLRAGTVWVNAHVLLDPNMPFGGVKQSGMGREFGRTVIEAYTELKSVCIAH